MIWASVRSSHWALEKERILAARFDRPDFTPPLTLRSDFVTRTTPLSYARPVSLNLMAVRISRLVPLDYQVAVHHRRPPKPLSIEEPEEYVRAAVRDQRARSRVERCQDYAANFLDLPFGGERVTFRPSPSPEPSWQPFYCYDHGRKITLTSNRVENHEENETQGHSIPSRPQDETPSLVA